MDAEGVGTATAVGLAIFVRLAVAAGRHNQRTGRSASGWGNGDPELRRAERMMARRARRDARAAAAPAPSHSPDTSRRVPGSADAPIPAAAPAHPADEVTFAQLVDRARWLVVDRQDASPNLLRAELGIDSDTVLRVLYQLEQRGVVGPATMSLLPRQVLVPRGQ